MRRRLTLWIGEHYGDFFDSMEFMRRLSTLSELIRRTTVQSHAWKTDDKCIPSKDRSQTRLSTLPLLLSSGG
ncbi:unnamed protein product [Schistosoma curassoni]|uniref:Uncharacterized protein n=1 Tax=Schistosoma curassoni TaxID=6186 RepID=A0A183K177_9TREM|nr:unnamed protein product [Schistosoma curassoni]